MKKLTAVLSIALFVASNANAKDGFYVGLDALRANAEHNYKIVYTSPADSFIDTGDKTKAISNGFSANAGYKFNFDQAFIAPEIFYDRLNNSANDFTSNTPETHKDTLNLDSRYGAKVNLGYNILPKLAVFVNAGLSNVRYSVKWPSVDNARYGHKLAMVYGFGAAYNIDNNWAARVSYDKQEFNIQWIYEGLRSKVDLTVVKAGLVYSF